MKFQLSWILKKMPLGSELQACTVSTISYEQSNRKYAKTKVSSYAQTYVHHDTLFWWIFCLFPKEKTNNLFGIIFPEWVRKWISNDMSPNMTKPTKWVCAQRKLRSAWASDLNRVFAVRIEKAWVLTYPLSAQQRLWSDWADAQADLILRWAHTHFVGFVISRLILRPR